MIHNFPEIDFLSVCILPCFLLFFVRPSYFLHFLHYLLTYIEILTISLQLVHISVGDISLSANVSVAPSVKVYFHTGTSYSSSCRDMTILTRCRCVVQWMHMCAARIILRVDVRDALLTSYVFDHKTSVICSTVEPLVEQCVSRHALSSAIKPDSIFLVSGFQILYFLFCKKII